MLNILMTHVRPVESCCWSASIEGENNILTFERFEKTGIQKRSNHFFLAVTLLAGEAEKSGAKTQPHVFILGKITPVEICDELDWFVSVSSYK